ncbi:MAG: hypothetical protein ACK6D1_11410 [Planctomycetota bacterium]
MHPARDPVHPAATARTHRSPAPFRCGPAARDEFVDDFDIGEPDGDYNRDGFIDFFDYNEFVDAFDLGC